jgi:hypothetical protein
MTADLIQEICAIRLKQRDTSSLLSPHEVEPWVQKAETRRNRLVAMRPDHESTEFIEHDCIQGVLDDIQEYRARIIWEDAYFGRGDISVMTRQELDLYKEAAGIAATLRGTE